MIWREKVLGAIGTITLWVLYDVMLVTFALLEPSPAALHMMLDTYVPAPLLLPTVCAECK